LAWSFILIYIYIIITELKNLQLKTGKNARQTKRGYWGIKLKKGVVVSDGDA
jgi:hypothetical protein